MEPMKRVAIIGCGGSGKTTVGRRLAAAIGTKITHLDAVFYDDEWNKLVNLYRHLGETTEDVKRLARAG